jgi:sugar lactone lactonase YvrE
MDSDRDSLVIKWSSTNGKFIKIEKDSVRWTAPDTSSSATIYLKVDDLRGGIDIDSIIINIENHPPIISDIIISPKNVFLGNTAVFRVLASDPEGQSLSYEWSAQREGKNIGKFIILSGDSTVWIAPSSTGNVTIKVIVRDTKGGEANLTKNITVYSAIGSVWVSDTYNNRVIMLSSTGDVLYEIKGFNNPEGIDINKNDRTVLVADWRNNSVVKISPDGKIVKQISGFVYPHSVSIRSFDGTAWVCQDGDSSQVVMLTPEGVIIKRIHGLSNPQSIVINQTTGDVWITDTGNNRIVKLLKDIPDGYNLNNPPPLSQQKHKIYLAWNSINFNEPMGISVNSTTGDCWFADKGNNRVVRILSDGSKIDGVIGFSNPKSVSINRNSLDAWVADTGNNRVIKLKNGIFNSEVIYNVSFHQGFHWIVPGTYRQPLAVSVNSNDGEVWFTEERRVIKVSNDANIIEVIEFNTPKGIVVNPGVE